MPTTAHVSRQLLCKGIAVCPYRHKSSQNFRYHFWPSPTGTSHPRKTWNRPLLKKQRHWNRNSALGIPGLAPLLSPLSLTIRCGIHCTFLEASLEKKSASEYSAVLPLPSKLNQTICLILRLSQTHDKDILNPLFFLLGFVFSSQNEKSSFTSEGLCSIISLALISLPQSPAYFKRMKSVLTAHCHWSLFPILIPRHSFSF